MAMGKSRALAKLSENWRVPAWIGQAGGAFASIFLPAGCRLCDELLGSAKNRQEHQVVVAEVAEALRPRCDTLRVPEAPSIVPLRNVSHLGTLIEGTLSTVAHD